jgi:hypothetical protein
MNDPTDVVVKLGGREFPIKDLPYDDYLQFLLKLQPLLESIVGKIASFKGVSMDTGESLTSSALLKYCGTALPELVRLICKQSVPDVTTDDIKRLCPSPFLMASVVMAQVQQNRMISDFADFFGQVLPLMNLGSTEEEEPPQPKKSRTRATRS